MKKLLVLFTFISFSFITFAQKMVTIKGGTIIPLEASQTVRAADVYEGKTVDFFVSRDIIVDDECIINRGTIVQGKVVEAQKSSIAGTKGRLWISVNNMLLPNGEPLYFTNTDIRIFGKNKTALAIVLACFAWPCIFIPGTRAEMPAGYEVQAIVASNTNIKVK